MDGGGARRREQHLCPLLSTAGLIWGGLSSPLGTERLWEAGAGSPRAVAQVSRR